MQLMLTLLCTYDSSDILDLQIFDKFNHQRFSFESIKEFFYIDYLLVSIRQSNSNVILQSV